MRCDVIPAHHNSYYAVIYLCCAVVCYDVLCCAVLCVQVSKVPAACNLEAWVHRGFSCGVCRRNPIMGFRFLCSQCGLNLCQACEYQGLHDVRHTRLRFAEPQ